MDYTLKNFIADLAPRAGWDDATLADLTASIESGQISEEQAKTLKEAAHNMGTVDFFKNDRSGSSIVSHARAEVWDGVTNDTLNAFLDHFSDVLDPAEIKLAFSNPKQRFGEKRDTILAQIRENYEAKMKGLVNSDSVNKLIAEKDTALQDAREKLKAAKAEAEKMVKDLERRYETDLIRRDIGELVTALPLANPAQVKAAARFLESELSSRFYLARTENGVEARSLEDPSLPATDPESKTTVNLLHFAKAVLNENGFLARNNGGAGAPPTPPAPPQGGGDDKTKNAPRKPVEGIAEGSHQDAMLTIYERFRPPQS